MRNLDVNSTVNFKEVKELTQIGVLESKNFDSKKKLNCGGKYNFTKDFLSEIEKDGLTYEQLLTLEKKVPIFKYLTQITVHGVFENNDSIYGVGNYKNLIINKNKSLGIKYNAIDYAKKIELASLLKPTAKIGYTRNSTENYFSFVSRDKNETQKVYDRINTDLFLGTKGIYSFNYFGTYFYYCKINIDSFPIENLIPIAENIAGISITEIKTIISEKETAEKLSNDIYMAKYNAEREATKLKNEAIQNDLLENGKVVKFDGTVGFQAVYVDKNDSYNPIRAVKYMGKRGAYHTLKTVNLKSIESGIDFDHYSASKISDKDLARLQKFCDARVLISI